MLRPFSFWRELAVTCGGSGEGGHLPVPDLRDDIHCGGLGHIQFPSTPSLLSVFTTKGVELFWHQWRTLHSLMNLICSGCGPALLQAAPVNALSLPESNGLFSVFPSLDPQHQPGRLLPFSGVMPPGRHTCLVILPHRCLLTRLPDFSIQECQAQSQGIEEAAREELARGSEGQVPVSRSRGGIESPCRQ